METDKNIRYVMKKLLLLIAAITTCSLTFQSCLSDTDDKSDATCWFCGNIDSIGFTDPADSVFIPCIVNALGSTTLAVAGDNSWFSTFAAGEDINLVLYECRKQAISDYSNKLNGITGNMLREQAQTYNGDTLSVDSLDAFTVKYGLYDSYLTNAGFTKISEYYKNY